MVFFNGHPFFYQCVWVPIVWGSVYCIDITRNLGAHKRAFCASPVIYIRVLVLKEIYSSVSSIRAGWTKTCCIVRSYLYVRNDMAANSCLPPFQSVFGQRVKLQAKLVPNVTMAARLQGLRVRRVVEINYAVSYSCAFIQRKIFIWKQLFASNYFSDLGRNLLYCIFEPYNFSYTYSTLIF